MTNFNEISNFIWSIADLIRDVFKRGKYQDVILPFTTLKRLDSVLEGTKKDVLETAKKLSEKGIENRDPQLRKASGYAFYNTSRYTFRTLLDDAQNLRDNLTAYINSFSPNVREIMEKFDFFRTIEKLDQSGLLYLVMQRFNDSHLDLHPDKVDNLTMGYVFEDLIRRFNEALNENPGEHFTPREVIKVMVNLSVNNDKEIREKNHIVRTIYDPCCGSGGMLSIAKERIMEINAETEVYLYGQEVNPETYALCKSDMLIKSVDGRDAENIRDESTLSKDKFPNDRFDIILANPPYGKDWSQDEKTVRYEASRGTAGRFSAGLPRKSDGQLLFLQHMISKMRPIEEGGSRIAIIMNGSPLFTGDAGSGESEIRRWIIENDWLEAIIAMPEQLFYNTGIATYIWLITNKKEERRKGKVQLIDATSLWSPMRKSLGNKRRELTEEHIRKITELYNDFKNEEQSKIFHNEYFGFRKITIERPLRLNFIANDERISRLDDQTAFVNLAKSKKKKSVEQISLEETQGKEQQKEIKKVLRTLPQRLYRNKAEFETDLDKAFESSTVKLNAQLKKAILDALSERDEMADICLDSKGKPEPDSELRDTETVPLGEDIHKYFEREVKPFVPDAWINKKIKDPKDGKTGKVGYEINFNRYFYEYKPPRSLEEIQADLNEVEREILDLLKDVIE
ncbi:DNA methyltransferase [Mesotoga sp. Brook.08.105.5.1]|uniref:type I restriction-modification system subunit M n=1 Tax=Mesotoga sp. Brook.08.105.5.1 TaxID=1421002 RepID=UPI000C19E6F6|nr:class I SAM-dependent DNA methyltransferase [Mesotoga sp. Brook.08.105.5.1]PVD16253.1 DNA methyltransferase [Mesotoga sp. Brook.08.105.5.1]